MIQLVKILTAGGPAMKWLKLIAILAPLISGCAKSFTGGGNGGSGGCKCCQCGGSGSGGDGGGGACWEPDATQLRMYQVLCYYRENAGLEPQRLDAGLSMAAAAWAERMAEVGRADHSGLRIAESVAEGYRWPRDVFRAWVRRPDCRAKLMGKHRAVGMGHAVGADGRHYWVVLQDQVGSGEGTGSGATGDGAAATGAAGEIGAAGGDASIPQGKESIPEGEPNG